MKVLCVGRNYAKHAKELGNQVQTPASAPIWFWKPDSAIIADGQDIEIPATLGPVHHEVELALRISKPIRRMDGKSALACIDAITVANDLTARELQQAAAKAGLPWAQAKGYDTFCPMAPWVAWTSNGGRDLQDLKLKLWVGDELRQDGWTGDMVHKVSDLLAHASTWTTLKPGDIVLTGTPDGVGPLVAGKTVHCEMVGVAKLANPVKSV